MTNPEYFLKAKQECYINGKPAVTFEVWEVSQGDRGTWDNVFIGAGYAFGENVSNARCLEVFASLEYE